MQDSNMFCMSLNLFTEEISHPIQKKYCKLEHGVDTAKILSHSLPLTNFRCCGFPLINEFKDLGPSTQLMRWEAAFHLIKGLSNWLEDLSNWSQPGVGI